MIPNQARRFFVDFAGKSDSARSGKMASRPPLVSLWPNRYPTLKGGFFNGGNGHTVSRPAVRFDEADRLWAHNRAEMAGGAAARQGDSRRRREGAPDTARRSAHDLRGCSDAVWLRRVHPSRDLAG